MSSPTRRRSISELPISISARVAALVEQSSPSLDRPRVNPKVDHDLECTERKNAACYASMEDASVRLRQLAVQIDDSAVEGVPAGFDNEDSAVHVIADLRERTR